MSWLKDENPDWNFDKFDYCVTLSPVAAGHNPHKMTKARVGVADGWRLLNVGEKTEAADEAWVLPGEWMRWPYYFLVGESDVVFRTKRPLPVKKMRCVRADELPPFIQICRNTALTTKVWCVAITRTDRYLRYGARGRMELGLAPATYAGMAWRGVDGVEHAFVVEEEAP
ncbi:MAG: hypothetical protein LBK60_03120 [Verrucomicrobiales bacterium]|nr:hypothetical protein [Verrucomicrobiales bacterium]